MKKTGVLIIAFVTVWFVFALSGVQSGQDKQAAKQLEDTVQRTAVTCYATNGFYPPDVEYMEEHYGLHYNKNKYTVHYEIFALNIMPDITVTEVLYEE